MFDFKTWLRKSAATAASIQAAIAEAGEELKAAQSTLARLQQERAGLLLEASDKELEAHDAKIARAGRDIDRLQAGIDALSKSHAAQVAAEAETALAATLDAATAAHREGIELVGKYAEHAQAIVAILRRLQEIEVQRQAANAAARSTGRAFKLPQVEAVTSANRIGHYRLLASAVVLPDPARSVGALWPATGAPLQDAASSIAAS